jgi:CubicO group peptidase (beta-lactamase class C family)
MALEIVDAWVADGTVSAVAAAVVGPEGLRETRFAGAAAAGSLFALASLTKPLVALAALVAAEEGAVDLDAPVAEHLGAYRGPGLGGGDGGRGQLATTARPIGHGPDGQLAMAARPIGHHPEGHGPDGHGLDRAAVTLRHLLAHASGLPESGPPGVSAVDVALERPPATRRVYSNEGYAVIGDLLAAATGMHHADYVHAAVFEPLGMDARIGLEPAEEGRALRVREPGLWRPGLPLFNSREWRDRRTAAGGSFATAGAYARFVQLLLAGGAPLISGETFADMAAVQFPGLAGGIESFLTWDTADWGLGCDIRDAKAPHWTGGRTSATTLSHFGASGTLMFADPAAGVGLVCLADRGTYSGWMMRPGGWPDLCDAVLDAA